MPAQADFSTLKEQVEEADQRIRASAAQGTDELKAMVDEARTKADARAAELSTKAQETADQAEAHWRQVQSDWDRHIKRFASASTPRRQSTTPMWQSATPSGPRPTHTTLSSSRRPPSKRLSTPCWTLCWQGKTRTYWLRRSSAQLRRLQDPERPARGALH